MIELNLSNKTSIKNGDFPLNHDCILKVSYIVGSPLRFSYFTCCAQHSGALVLLIKSIPLVKNVYTSSVENLDDIL